MESLAKIRLDGGIQDFGVDHSSGDPLMAEEFLQASDVHARVE